MSQLRRRKHPQVRVFLCTVCGAQNFATKHHGLTGPGHIKHMYCYRCNDTTEQVQIDQK